MNRKITGRPLKSAIFPSAHFLQKDSHVVDLHTITRTVIIFDLLEVGIIAARFDVN